MKTRLNSLIMILAWMLASLAPVPARAQTTPTWTGQIAYIGGDGNVWVLHSDTAQPLQVTTDASPEIRYYSPLFSPAGDLLAYCRNNLGGAGGSQLYLARTASWQSIQLVDDVFCQGLPQLGFDWSPDGTTIAYTRSFVYGPQPDGSQWSKYHGIWSVDVATGQSVELIPPPGTNPLVYPRWSPDGRWIRLYELVYLEGLGVLRTWNRDNGALYNWLEVGADMFPGSSDWSPDSVRLVFDQVTYVGFPGAGLYTALPDSREMLSLYINPSQGVMRPIWSPDGANVAFQLRTYGDNERTGIGLIAPNGGNFREIYQTQANLEIQDWSPNGTQLLFVSDDGGQANLYIYDMPSATQFQVVASSGWQASWAPIPKTTQPENPSGAVEIEGFRASGGSLLAYLGENYQLWLYDPESGSRGELSEPLSATSFWSSPSGLRLIYADRLLNLSFQEDGSLTVQEIRLPANPSGDEIHWSPGESRLAYRDALGRVWLVQPGSDFIEVPGATDIPNWSFDGRFISYCTEGNRLWVVGGGISLREVASSVDCGGAWSSSQNLLAYTLTSDAGASSDQVYVYDPEQGKSSLVMDGASLIGWSPDGEVLGMRQEAKSGSGSYTYFAAKPPKGKPLEVGPFNQTQPGEQGWAEAGDSYILGPYQIDKNLRSSERVAPAVYDAAKQGQILLLGDAAGVQHALICQDVEADQSSNLLEVDLNSVPASDKPGMWARLSPDGSWAASNNFAPDGYRYLLTRCDRNRQAALQASSDASGDSFSTDSRWYVQRLPGESRGGLLLLYNLETLDRESLPALSSSPAVWVQPPANAFPETYVLSGMVIAADGTSQASVNILVDGQPAATTSPDGSFEVSGLAPGEHTVSALKSGLVFSPESQTFKVPGDNPEVIFEAAAEGAPGVEDTQQAIAKPVELTPTPSIDETPTQPPLAGGGGSISTATLWMYVCGGLIVIFLLAVLIYRISQRRKSQTQPAEEPLPVAPEPGAQPVAKTALDPELNLLLKEGVDQVKSNQNAAGRETLKKVLVQAPDNAIAWLWSGMAATRMKDWRAAEHSFQQAKKLGHPKADDALKWLAEERRKSG